MGKKVWRKLCKYYMVKRGRYDRRLFISVHMLGSLGLRKNVPILFRWGYDERGLYIEFEREERVKKTLKFPYLHGWKRAYIHREHYVYYFSIPLRLLRDLGFKDDEDLEYMLMPYPAKKRVYILLRRATSGG